MEVHQHKLGCTPRWLAADAGYYSRANEEGAHALGVKHVSLPNRSARSEERRKLEKQRWFKRSGGRDAKAGSAWSSDGTDWQVAATTGPME